MPIPDPVATLSANALALLDEVFNEVHDCMLEPGDSLGPTLRTITAEQASVIHAPGTGCIAAHVDHIAFYIHTTIEDVENADWEQSWTITSVRDEEWDALRANLGTAFNRLATLIARTDEWSENTIGVTLLTIAHSSYHLGQIREILATFRT